MPDLLEALVDALAPELERRKERRYGVSLKHDITGTPATNQYSHGPGGSLTYPGVDPVVFSNIMGNDSIISQIPFNPSVYMNPTFETITGIDDVTGSEMTGTCDNAPVAGLMKGCITTSVFGRYERATPLIDIGRLGARIDRADPLDLRLLNTPMANGGPFMGNSDVSMTPQDLLINEVTRKFWERNIALYRLLAKQIWIGNPATGNTAGGGYQELTGLQLLVNTGYVDAVAGSTCSSMDSYVRNFNFGRIDGNATNTVAFITDVARQLTARARRANVTPVRWVIAMREGLFYELTNIWPCAYMTFRCVTASASTPDVTNATEMVKLRDDMRAGKFLWIDGVKWDVVFDDGIPEKDGNNSGGSFPRGCFSTDIYFLPMSIAGGTSVLFGEYFQFQNPSIQDALGGGNMILGRIDGPWLTWPRQTNMCVQWQSRIQPRIILRTPWLAARIQNVTYCPIQHDPEPFPGDPYFSNPGVGSRSGPSYHSLWAS